MIMGLKHGRIPLSRNRVLILRTEPSFTVSAVPVSPDLR